ncbi:hypothetical protein I4U23_020581 [Adineta vaga]|nr:hypothetical protein I4U23_020581 [Adineta vaga]
MGANKTKLPKTVQHQLAVRTNRKRRQDLCAHGIFRRHFPNGKIESPQDLWRCLQKFLLQPMVYDESTAERLYRLFDIQSRRGSAHDKIRLYFESLDVDNNGLIDREDLEKCLPHTVESQQLIQQLLKQWDMNKNGTVTLNDFERYIHSNPHLSPMFIDVRERVRMNSVTQESTVESNSSIHNHPTTTTDNHPSTYNFPANRNLFITSK